MNVIIPLCGKGTRFRDFANPKPLIPILGKPMIKHVLDHLQLNEDDKVYIIYNDSLKNHLSVFSAYQNVILIKLDSETDGAAETLLLGINKLIKTYQYHKKCLIIDCDTFYTSDVVGLFREMNHNIVFYTKQTDDRPIYSYISIEGTEEHVIDIQEKVKISDNANTGAYGFVDIHDLIRYCKHIIYNKIKSRNEYYTSCVISQMIKDGIRFVGHQLPSNTVYSLGTPADVSKYIQRTFAFLFDLDGTIVDTDDIYYHVWSEILLKYNIHLTPDIFNRYIQGNNDKTVIKTLLVGIDISLEDLSREKDKLFLERLKLIKVVDGSIEFIKAVFDSGYPCCIVTNCNQKVALAVIKAIHIDRYIDFIISPSDCVNGKPSPEPYQTAIQRFEIQNHKCIIFEDSKSGIISGKGVNPKTLVGLETKYSHQELTNIGVTVSIPNFVGLTIASLLDSENEEFVNLKTCITQSLNLRGFSVDKLIINSNKMKGGFIADIIEVDIYTPLETIRAVFKYESTNTTNLSRMAKRLDLYEREYYFYTDISSCVNVQVPKFISLVRGDECSGILLERMPLNEYHLNLDLNQEDVDVSLKVVSEMARLHSKFWGLPLTKLFPQACLANGDLFNPFIKDFIKSNIDTFKEKWSFLISPTVCDSVVDNFDTISTNLFSDHLTFIHGDIKSPNLFYLKKDKHPVFIDWQHSCIGKGVQDLMFFVIESFSVGNIKLLLPLFKYYYYQKLIQNGVTNYPFDVYEKDLKASIYYIPFFTAVWFGTTPADDLIDKNFPYMFIQKLSVTLDLI